FWPADLAAFYPYVKAIPEEQVAAAVLILALVSVASFLLVRREPFLAVGWFWFLGTLVPVIGLVQAGLQAMADRYTYVPLIGVFIAVTWIVATLLPLWRFRLPALAATGIAILAACIIQTARHVR